MYRNNFPSLDDQSIQNGITYIDAVYPGIFSLFSQLNQSQKVAKQTVLENLLVAWYLADSDPKAVSGVVANGFPVTSKTIGGTKGVSLTFRQVDVQPGMEFLNTNFFGNQALQMFMGSPDRFGIYSRNRVGVTQGTGGGQGR
jgi:hypothetical protein